MGLLEFYAKDRQIVVATHSPYFITRSAMANGCTICRTWDRDGSIELFETSVEDTESGLSQLVSENRNNPHVFGLDAREVFFLEDNVVVFEGQEDVVLWPRVIGDAGSQPYNTYGWGAGGASNLKWVLMVLQKLGFRRVAGILDNDRSDDLSELDALFPTYFVRAIPAPDMRTKRPVSAKAAKAGLLDERMTVRPELRIAVDALKHDLNQYMKSA